MTVTIGRRELLVALGGAAAAWPFAARAQQGERMKRLGILMAYPEGDQEGQAFLTAFREELEKLGWMESRNLWIDTRWAPAADAELRLKFAKELVALHPDLILSHGTPSTATLLQQTRTLPILFVNVTDPIGSGFLTSFAKPGGNVTGFINMEPTIAGKWLQLLKEIAPRVTRCAILFNPATAPYAEYFLAPFRAAAASFAVEAIIARVRDAAELETAIVALAREPNGGLIVMPDIFTTVHRAKIAALTAQYRLPAVYPFNFFATSGGLLSYGSDTVDSYRRAAPYANRIRSRVSFPSRLPSNTGCGQSKDRQGTWA